MEENLTNPVEEVEAEVQQEAEGQEVQEIDGINPDELPIEAVESEVEDVEFEGKKYTLPKEVKGALLRNADYTRKTQALAEERKAVEAFKAQVEQEKQAHTESLKEYASLMAIDQSLEQFGQIDWQSLINDNPIEAMKLQQRRNDLLEKRNQQAHKLHEVTTKVQQERALKEQMEMQKGIEIIASKIKDWGPARVNTLLEYGQKTLSADAKELAGERRPWVVVALDKAERYDRLIAAHNAKKQAPPPPPPETVGNRSRATTGYRPDMTDAEYIAWRKNK